MQGRIAAERRTAKRKRSRSRAKLGEYGAVRGLDEKEDVMLWFKHMSDSRRNPKMFGAQRALGEAGYSRYFKLLEVVAERGGKGEKFRPEVDLNSPATGLEWLAYEWGIEVGATRETLDLFATLGLIDEGAWSQLIICIPQMLEIRDEYVSRRQKMARSPKRKDSEKKKKSRGRVEVVEREEEVEVEEEENGQPPASNGSVSGGQEQEPVREVGTSEKFVKVKGPIWARLGFRSLPAQYKPFIKIVNETKPSTIEETIGVWCGRVLDECSSKEVLYPPEFLARTRRYRAQDEDWFTHGEKIAYYQHRNQERNLASD